MSDAMSAIEIEDVLSSIRRLVSEDLRPVAARVPGPEPRLILTPALRVVPQTPEDTWDDEENWTEEPVLAQLSPSGWSLPEAEPEPADLDAPLALPMQPASVRLTAAEPIAPAQLPPHRFTLTQAARVLPAESAERPAAWDQPSDQPVDGTEPVPETRLPATPKAEQTRADQVWADQAAREAIAGIEADEDFDEDFDELSDPPFEDPLKVISEADPSFHADEEDTFEDDAPEATYDQVMLRELVRDILREELSGALGEKITRNVRKLVRAEIAQALVARDLG